MATLLDLAKAHKSDRIQAFMDMFMQQSHILTGMSWKGIAVEVITARGVKYTRNYDEGDPCPDPNCLGTLHYARKPCECSTMKKPPCSSCTDATLRCNTCSEEPQNVDTI